MQSNLHLQTGIHLERSGRLIEALRSYQAAEQNAAGTEARAEALRRQGDVYRAQGEWALAEGCIARSAALAREYGHGVRLAEALNAEGILRWCLGEREEAARLFRQVEEHTDDPLTRGLAYQNLGNLAAHGRDFAAAEQLFMRSYACFGQASFSRGAIFLLINVGTVLSIQGKHDQADLLFTQALDEAAGCGEFSLYGIAAMDRAECRMELGRLAEALIDVGKALSQFGRARDRQHRMVCMRIMGDLFLRQGDQEMARRYYVRGLAFASDLRLAAECDAFNLRLRRLQPEISVTA